MLSIYFRIIFTSHEMGVLHQVMAAMKAGVGVKEITALMMAAGLTSEDVDRLSGCVAQVAEAMARSIFADIMRLT